MIKYYYMLARKVVQFAVFRAKVLWRRISGD